MSDYANVAEIAPEFLCRGTIWDLLVGDVEHVLKNVIQFWLLMKGKNALIVENLVHMGAWPVQGLKKVLEIFLLMKGRKKLLTESEHDMWHQRDNQWS